MDVIDRKIIGIRLAFTAVMLNSCLKFTNCSECPLKKEFYKEYGLDDNQCPYTAYYLKTSLKNKFTWCIGSCASCEFAIPGMQTRIIRCSTSYVFFRMCGKHKKILG